MLIEVEKRYITRDGRVVGPANPQPQSPTWPWHIPGIGSYTNSGRFNGEIEDKNDLIHAHVGELLDDAPLTFVRPIQG